MKLDLGNFFVDLQGSVSLFPPVTHRPEFPPTTVAHPRVEKRVFFNYFFLVYRLPNRIDNIVLYANMYV